MGLIAEYELRCPHLPLVDVAATCPSATLTVDVGQPNQGGLPPFVVRVTADDAATIERAFADAAFVDTFTCVGRTREIERYRIHPATTMDEQLGQHLDDPERLRKLASNDSIVEHVEVIPDGWIQRRWFADRAAFDEYRRFWQRNGDGFSLRELRQDTPGDGGEGESDDELTDRQREALRVAHEMGYFDVPRSASLGDVASELGISAASASERLRRAQSELVEAQLATRRATPSSL